MQLAEDEVTPGTSQLYYVIFDLDFEFNSSVLQLRGNFEQRAVEFVREALN